MREMKNSGIEWLGDIPCDWELSQIKSVYTERKTKVSDKDYPPLSVTMKGIVPQLATAAKSDAHDDRKLVLKGDFAINSRSDRRGSCGISQYDGSVSLINTILCPREQSDAKYYDWLFHTTMFADEFYKWGHGIVDDLWTTNWQDMKRISIPVPPMQEQKKIADFLDEKCEEIDTVIEKTKATIEEYKKLKQSVITQAVTKGIRPNRPMKDSGIDYLGYIPFDWSITSINNLFRFIGGYAFKSELFCEETDNQVIRIGNIRDDNLILDNKCVYIDDEYAQEAIVYRILENDILFSMTGTRGKQDYFYTLLVNSDHMNKNLFLNQRVGCFRSKSDVDMRYYSYLLKVKRIKDFIFLFETGTANQGNLGIETIKRTKLLLPCMNEQKEIADYLDKKCSEIDELIAKKTSLLSELESYKKSLIYEYVTGKKEV